MTKFMDGFLIIGLFR